MSGAWAGARSALCRVFLPLSSASLLLAGVGVAGEGRAAPILDLRTRPTQYLGPDREQAVPAGLRDLQIAFFGPADPNHPTWGDAWRGAHMAVEEANLDGQGPLPFRLTSAWSENPWGSGVSDLAKLAFGQHTWAVLGGVNGETTHLAEQIAVKARLSVVSPGGTDPSVNYTNVPWMFTLLPTDDRIAPLLAQALGEQPPWAAVTTTDRDAAAAWRALRRVLAGERAPAPLQQVALPSHAPDYRKALEDVARSEARAVLVLAGPEDSAAIVAALRTQHFAGRIVGGPAFGRRVFRDRAGSAADDAVFPLLFEAESAQAREFVRSYERRWGAPPDYLAAHAYDGARLLIAAVRRAGPNRALIRDALVALSRWPGVSGPVTWDLTGRSLQPVSMGTWQGRRVTSQGRR